MACEACTTTGLVVVLGEITTEARIDVPDLVRDTIKDIGYTNSQYGFDYESCAVMVSLNRQSSDIAGGVDVALEVRGEVDSADAAIEMLGAGDQGMMVGYACDETDELMPMPIALAHKLTRRMAEVRKSGLLSFMRPDGKSQVTVEYAYGKPKRVDTVVLSTQHSPDVSQSTIESDLIEHVAAVAIPSELLDDDTTYHVNPSGRFVIGGPTGDAGLTGRKILVDTYGGMARHGGGAFSGKDPTKVDRSAAYAARWVAKNLVAAGLAERLEIQVSYAIGMAKPMSVSIETFGTNNAPDDVIVELADKHFDLRPGAIIRDLGLRAPIYKQTAAYGHFGRDDLDLPWERTGRAEAIRKDWGQAGGG